MVRAAATSGVRTLNVSMIRYHGINGGCDGGVVMFITYLSYCSNTFTFLLIWSEALMCWIFYFIILNETLFWFCLFRAPVNISLLCYRYSGSSKAELGAEDLQRTTRILTAWTCTLTLTQEGVFIIFRLFSGWLGFILFLIRLTVSVIIWYKFKKKIQCPCLINFFPNCNGNLFA